MFKALVSFSGLISMTKGQVKEINNKEIVEDLLRAGYIEKIKPVKEVKPTKKKKEEE